MLLLWSGTAGMNVLCKLYVGETVAEYQHSFDGTSPCSMRRCFLGDGTRISDDSLRVGVEILESFRILVGLPAEPGSLKSGCDPNGDPRPQIGSLQLHRFMCPSAADRVQDLQYQVDRLRSRMLGRVEWQLKQASLLQQCFPRGEFLCSAPFAVAGVEDMQLVFYPCGMEGSRADFCSVFLHAPGCSSLRCFLSAGKRRYEAPPASEPGVCGKMNFCCFNACVDSKTDTVTIGIEVAEGQERHSSAFEPATEPSAGAVPWTTLACPGRPGIEQIEEYGLKLEGKPGRIALEDLQRLPSIWTFTPAGTEPRPTVWTYQPKQMGLPEGFHTFGELRGVAVNSPCSWDRLAYPDGKNSTPVSLPLRPPADDAAVQGTPRSLPTSSPKARTPQPGHARASTPASTLPEIAGPMMERVN